MNSVKRMLNFVYYSCYVFYCLLILIFGHLLKGEFSDVLGDDIIGYKTVIQSVVIIYMLASIPGALYGFKRKMAQVAMIENEDMRLQQYSMCATQRLLLIFLGAVMGIVAFYVINDMSMLWCAGICILAQFFCKPTEKKIFMEMNDIREDDPRMGQFNG